MVAYGAVTGLVYGVFGFPRFALPLDTVTGVTNTVKEFVFTSEGCISIIFPRSESVLVLLFFGNLYGSEHRAVGKGDNESTLIVEGDFLDGSAGFALRTLRTGSAGFTLRTLWSGSAGFTLRTLRSGGAGVALGTLRSGSTGFTLFTLRTLLAGFTLFAFLTVGAVLTVGADGLSSTRSP